MKIIECVPNVSEGRNKKTINAIADEIVRVPGVKLLDVCMDHDHHRSVFTFIGSAEDVEKAALKACGVAIELIDMKHHRGVHPRIGAVDVVPFIPLQEATMQDAVNVAHRFGITFGKTRCIPVYFYGEAALSLQRRALPDIRRGGYEGLAARMTEPLWKPDAGPATFHARSGATAVGAREPLIAFNVNLKSDNLDAAKKIAGTIRESNGGLPHVRAIGVPLTSRNIVQVSMNLTNYKVTPLRRAFEAVREEASRYGIDVLESELIGLIPETALEGTTAADFLLAELNESRIIERHLKSTESLTRS